MAKTARVSRKNIIQPDHFISSSDVIIAYCSKHKAKLFTIAISLIFLVFLGLWIKYSQNEKLLEMESLYFRVEQIKSAEGTSANDKIQKIEILLKGFKKGPQKERAFLILADQHFNEGSFDKAIETYQGILSRTPSSLNQQMANIGIAYSFEGKSDYKNAIRVYKTVINHPNKYPLFDIFLGLARCYELNNQNNEALLTLREMQNKFSNSPKIDLINSKINILDT